MPTSEQLLAELKLLHPRLIDLSLGRIETLLDRLGHPELRLPPVIHIAGTNGKGSVLAYLRAIFEAASLRVHTYTSPHLVRFHERIGLAGADGKTQPIGDAALADVLERVREANGGAEQTFFEITTAAALQAFSEHPADAVLLEVGLGGRLDATNVVPRPALTVITPVALDHMDKLGDTLAKIATEKAGILKPDVTAVLSAQPPAALDAIRARARAVRAPLLVWGEDYEAFEQRGRLVYQSEDILLDLPLPGLVGRHQIGNAGTAVAAAVHLRPLGISDDAIAKGIAAARWPARMQPLAGGPLAALLRPGAELWLDGGHNPAGGEAIAQSLADLEERAAKPVGLVLGMMGQKDAAGFLRPFRDLVRHIITVPIPGAHEAPFAPDELARLARDLGFAAEPASGIGDAVTLLQKREPHPMRILICGSLYLAGHVLALQEGVTAQTN